MSLAILNPSNEISGLIVFTIIASIFFKIISSKYITHKSAFKLFLLGFLLRIFGVALSTYFNLYIVKADSLSYYSTAKGLSKAFSELGFRDAIKFFLYDFEDLPFKLKCYFSVVENTHLGYDMSKTIIHLASIFSYFTFDSYLAVSLFFSLWGYVGIWLIYFTLSKRYPESARYFYLFIIAYPPLFFWTTGIAKESICIGCIGILFFLLFYKIKNQGNFIITIIAGLLSVFLLIKIKIYLFFVFMFSFFLTWLIHIFNKSIPVIRRNIIVLFIVGIIGILILYYYTPLPMYIAAYVENGIENVLFVGAAQLAEGGSSYDIGKVELNILSIIGYMLKSINVALFRPYLWEYAKPQVLLSAFEGLFMFSMLVYILVKKRLLSVIKLIVENRILLFSFFFTILLAIIIGGISFNFGTLSRYKIPLMPFYFGLIFIVYSNNSCDKKSKN